MTPPRAEPPQDDAESSPLSRANSFLSRTDSSEAALKAAKFARSLAPGETISPKTDRTSDRLARMIGDSSPDRPSAVRELGLATVAVWQNVIERRRPAPDSAPVPATILFTDLVSFSTWALRAGDDLVLDLIKQVNDACARVIRRRGGQVVKTLGDGTMAVFVDAAQAIEAAYECGEAVSAITVEGHRPSLRAGLHTGEPRAVGDDFLGVDVNIAARVCDAAGAGEVYVSDATLAAVDAERYVVKRRRFRAKGVPKDMSVYRVLPRYDRG
ncbi:adenylate and guanylate cyclase catalytic domain-containing protein [Gordonia spumicola]|uniref:Adenylate and guanylate cyclase catalytic domain-containing protein n=1 Tax=Gordonia spumicola TaxID=589161 RepID=A0A7I9VCM4_9ACTN|nr:adenylate/guanylate cyclase domain-containing protein [Gordonia spumicola]GEE02891.1 adenylate and guanylate cyclase catalytic domain-containing protein [Gordonia spumicola]